MFIPLWNVIYEVGSVGPKLKYEFYVPAENATDALVVAIDAMNTKELSADDILKVEKTKMVVFVPETSVDS